MYRYTEELHKYGLRSHTFSRCVSDGVCCARRPGSGSARSVWPRGAACPLSCCFQYHNKLHSSTLTHHALWQMAASSPFVCQLLCGEAAVRERKPFLPPPRPHVPAKHNRKEIWLVQKVCAAGGRPREASSGSSHQRED